MASKINWIAFILYISLWIPESFSTTLEPSSELSYFTSSPTGSTHNASDITNTSMLPQVSSSSPSPEISTGSEEVSHINEEQSTQTNLSTTVPLGDEEDLNQDEYSSTRLPGSTISTLDSDVINSTAKSEESPATSDFHNPYSKYRLPYLKKHLISKEKLSYVKLSSAKKVIASDSSPFTTTDRSVSSSTPSTEKEMAKKPPHFATTNESTASSVPDSVPMNETVESSDHYWGNVSNFNKTSDNEFDSKVNKTRNHTSDFQEIADENLREESSPDSDDMLLQSAASQVQESRPNLNSSVTKMDNQDLNFEPDFDENLLGYNNTLALAEESSKSKPVLHQNGRDNEKNGTNEFVPRTELGPNEEDTTSSESRTESLSAEDILVNSSSTYDNVSASETPSKKTAIRKKRTLVADTEPPKRYISPTDSSEIIHSLLTGSSNTDGSNTQLLTSTKDNSDSSYVTTSHLTEDVIAEEQSISSAIYPVSLTSSTYASEDALSNRLTKESADSESPVTSAFGGTTSALEASDSQNYDDRDISVPVISENSSPGNNSLEKESVLENTVVSSMPLCADDEETDSGSTSEISIKVFPLCEKRNNTKLRVTTSNEGTILQNETSGNSNFIRNSSTKIESVAASTPESTFEVLQDPGKTLDSSSDGSPGVGTHYPENITMSRETSSEPDDRANDSDSFKGSESNSPEPESKGSVKKALAEEDILTKTSEEPESNKNLESSEAPKAESRSNLTEVKFAEVGEEMDQSLNDHNLIAPSEMGNIDSNTNRSLKSNSFEQSSSIQTDLKSQAVNPPLHQTLKEAISNSSSFDYMSDQSEPVPVISDPRSQNFSFLQDFATKKEFKMAEDGSADVSSVYPLVDITSSNNKLSPSDSYSETLVTDFSSSEQPVPSKAPEQNISSASLSQTSALENSTAFENSDEGRNQDENITKTKSDNSTNMETKIAGVGVKTTVSVSLNVSKTNSTNMDNQNSFNGTAGPTVTMINLTASDQRLANEFIKIAKSLETSSDGPQEAKGTVDSADKSSALPSEPPNTNAVSSSGTPSPLPPPSTTRRSFAIRKPRIRLNGGDSESPVSRKPFLVKTPPTRASDLSSPVVIFQQARTRLASITSSTTPSTTLRTSRQPYVGRPMTWSYGSGNLSFVPEAETTVPTTTEEEVTEDLAAGDVTFPTISGCDNVVIKVPASIVVKKGLNCMVHFKNKHSPEYKVREQRMQKMLEILYIGSDIASRVCSVEIEGFHCSPKSRKVTVDYNLYLSKNGSAIERHHLATVFSGRLDNSTFNRYVLDTNGTVFEKPSDYIIVKPTQPTDAVEPPIPQWAIAVIVIGAASLVFIILFGALTVYGRHHMRRRYNGSRLGDDDVDRAIDTREWDDKMATYENLAADGIYDIDDGSFDSMKRPYRD